MSIGAVCLWESYRVWILEQLPEYGKIVKLYLDERREGVPCTCGVPIFAGEVFKVDEKAILEIGFTHIVFDHFTHVLDDLTDETVKNQPEMLHLSHSLLALGLERTALLPGGHHVREYLQDALSGERYLWRHHGEIIAYTDEDFAQTARRGALAKTALALCAGHADADKHDPILHQVERAVDSLSVALQLTDDLVDWKEDLQNRIFTYPLTELAISGANLGDKQSNVENLLITSKVASQTLELIQRLTTKGTDMLEGVCATEWQNYLVRFKSTLISWEERITHYNPHVPPLCLTSEKHTMMH
ncbi:MAG: hypothetical protein UR93_C0013G0009 [Berkelbacteria bacterium GW2011_GWA2_35_9]|uniref:Uncharacterized protein n=1 Tax=Berkelbacteria bacterium GW2011_GWA2_35_9 TaxID=1618333 RepID=A0A0G0D2G1_9BACT|nr:MAG: hypothetical protein UR93_C0013G0009 [Berkelbacteria bacterium GW2011_GWA2_35_9]